MSKKKNKRRRSTSTLYKIHRYLGLFVAISLIWLSLSGVLLNHTDFFQLAKKSVNNPLVLNLYGISKPQLGKVYKVGDKTVLQSGHQVYLDQNVLFEIDTKQFSVTSNKDMIFIGLEDQVKMYTWEAELIDSIPMPSSSSSSEKKLIQDLGSNGSDLFVQVGSAVYKTNAEFTDWTKAEEINQVVWSKEEVLSSPDKQKIIESFSGLFHVQGPTLEQFLLDSHSGRLFGKAGVFFADLIAFLTILLTLIGVFLWLKRSKNKRKKRNKDNDRPTTT